MSDRVAIKNERFVAAMLKLKKTRTEEAQAEFVEELVHSAEFYVPIKRAGEGREARPAFAIISDPEKHHYYALFTSLKKAKLWRADKKERTAYTRFRFQRLAAMSIGDPRIFGFVINAESDNFIIGRKMIADAAMFYSSEFMGRIPMKILESAECREAGEEADELKDALLDYMRIDPNISAAYFQEATIEGHEFYLLIISHIQGMQPSFENLEEIGRNSGASRPLAVVSARAEPSKKIISGLMPIYRKPFVLKGRG